MWREAIFFVVMPQKMHRHELNLSDLLAEKEKSTSMTDWEFGFWANLLEN